MKNHSALPIILLVTLSFIWGSSFILIKKGLIAFSPVQVGTLRMVFAFFVLLPFAVKNLKTVFAKDWKKIVTLGFIANLIPAILFPIAETGLSSSLTGILNSLTPIFTLIIGTMFYSTGIKSKQALGLIIGFIGSFVLTFVGSGGEFDSFNYYTLYVIAATICYGISGNYVKKHFSNINAVVLTSLTMFSVGTISLVYLLTTNFISVLVSHDYGWMSFIHIFILGALGTAFALILFNRLIQIVSAVFASSVTYLIPIVAVIWGVIDGESLYIFHFLGMMLIISGVYIVNKFK
ncbi:MAG: DMT family transporter [Ignavibacteria bacterium]